MTCLIILFVSVQEKLNEGSENNMTRIEEMKKNGYTLNIYGLDKQLYAQYKNVACFIRNHSGHWIIYGIKDNIIDEFNLSEFSDYSIITKNV